MKPIDLIALFGQASLLVLGLMAACTPTEATLPGQDAVVDASFADLAGLADGTVVRLDARPGLADAARLNDAGQVCRTGSTTGVVCTPSGTLVPGAEIVAVSRDCDGRRLEVATRADESGHFRVEGLSPGPAELTIRAGSFVGVFSVEIIAGVNVPASGGLSDKICLASRAAHLAVFTGDYDRIQNTLDGLGFEYDLVCGDGDNSRSGRALLDDPDRLAGYDILFFNCASGIDFRATNPEVRRAVEHLRAFVAGGGSVYISDLAADIIEQTWPEVMGFGLRGRAPTEAAACCVCTDCAPACVSEPRPPRGCPGCCPEPDTEPMDCPRGGGVGGSAQAGTVPAHIVAPYLADAVGSDAVEIVFNLGGWVPILSWAPSVEVLVEDERGQPLMAVFQPEPGGGRVAYTSFHHHPQITGPLQRLLAALVLRL